MIKMKMLGDLGELETEINRLEESQHLTLIQVIGPMPLSGIYFGIFRASE